MKKRFKDGSIRAQWWDYGKNAVYYITICTKDRRHFFGEIENKKMILSPLGAIAHVLWYEIPFRRKNIELGNFIVMPNHVHGILIINNPDTVGTGRALCQQQRALCQQQRALCQQQRALCQQQRALCLHERPYQHTMNQHIDSPGKIRFQNIGNNTLSSIIGAYKSAVTKYANRLELDNGWQKLFHDRIIRTEQEFRNVSDYIMNNPKNWKNDRFNPS